MRFLLASLAIPLFQDPAASRPAAPEPPPFPRARPFEELAQLAKPAPAAVRILLARHGESVGNATRDESKLSAAEKDRLTERGRVEAASLGAVFREAAVARILHSPAVRARETAEAARGAFPEGRRPELGASEPFRPLAYGRAPAGSTKAPLALLVEAWSRGEDVQLDEGERLDDVARRCRRGAAEIGKAHPGGSTVAVVAHGEVLHAWLAGFHAAFLPKRLVTVSIPNTAIAAFDVTADGSVTSLGLFVPPARAASVPR